MATNGELAVQRWMLASLGAGAPAIVFDIGANVGEWTSALLEAAVSERVELSAHCFEPSSYTADMLRRRLQGRSAVVNQMALSDRVGEATLHVTKPGGGTNSLVASPSATDLETVRVSTVDDYISLHGVEHVAFMKIDTEGNDLAVLRGAQQALRAERIGAIQFEYNQRWIDARSFLRDAFEVLEPCGYQLGKVTPDGIEVYPRGWDWELETFVEANFLAFRTPLRGITALRWWKDDA